MAGTVTLTGTGSTWTYGPYSSLYVGNYGSGTLNISGGAAVSNGYLEYIGYYSGSTGVVTVDGAGSTWTNSYRHAGNYGSGTLNITGGGTVASFAGYIGNNANLFGVPGDNSGSAGVVTVDGTPSTWTNSSSLYVGLNSSHGSLNISSGGTVSVGGTTYVGLGTGSTGTINFGTGGGTLTTGSLAASSSQLMGAGTINARGLISDINLVLDSTANLKQAFTFNNQPDQSVTVNLDLASNPSSNGDLGAGWNANGSLTIQGGITVNSHSGHIGYNSVRQA